MQSIQHDNKLHFRIKKTDPFISFYCGLIFCKRFSHSISSRCSGCDFVPTALPMDGKEKNTTRYRCNHLYFNTTDSTFWNWNYPQLPDFIVIQWFFNHKRKKCWVDQRSAEICFCALRNFHWKTKPRTHQAATGHCAFSKRNCHLVALSSNQPNFNLGLYSVSIVLPQPHQAIHP